MKEGRVMEILDQETQFKEIEKENDELLDELWIYVLMM